MSGCRSRNSSAISSTSRVVVPLPRERKLAAWIAGPSAIGSVNGMPSSITSAPPSTSASRLAAVSPSPAVMKHTSAGRPLAKAVERRVMSVGKNGAEDGAGQRNRADNDKAQADRHAVERGAELSLEEIPGHEVVVARVDFRRNRLGMAAR